MVVQAFLSKLLEITKSSRVVLVAVLLLGAEITQCEDSSQAQTTTQTSPGPHAD